MSYSINFESTRVKENDREETRKRREAVLERAKFDYERKKTSDKNLDKKWMLPSVEARIDSERKGKKHKKHKKKKKQKKSRKSECSDESSEEEEEWTEKVLDHQDDKNSEGAKTFTKREPAVRDEWMNLPSLLPCVAKDRKPPEKRKDQDKMILDSLGQSDRELNPYWKDGGAGLPSERKFEKKMTSGEVSSGTVGDRGADWLRRALKRTEEQAAEEGRTLEAVAAERWGSLEKLKAMLAEAETRSSRNVTADRKDWRSMDRRGSEPDKRRRDQDLRSDSGSFRRPEDRSSTFQRPREDYEHDRYHEDRKRDHRRDGYNNDKQEREEKSSDRSRVFQRPRDDEDFAFDGSRKLYERGCETASHEKRENSSSNSSRFFQRPIDDEDFSRSAEGRVRYEDRSGSAGKRENTGINDHSRMFQRPRDDDYGRETDTKTKNQGRNKDRSSNEYRERSASHEASRTFQKPREFEDNSRSSGSRFRKPSEDDTDESRRLGRVPSSSSKRPNWKKQNTEEIKKESLRKRKSSSSSSTSSSSDDDADGRKDTSKTCESAPVALSEREMNDLGAKLIKAEILGNETLAAELRKKLDEANAARSAGRISDEGPETEVVVLTRTDARGVTRPVPAATEPSRGRRRNQKVSTHDKEGKRVRYFADDDRMSLQEIFQKEKMNTVEDSNEMFAKLAGKVKTNDDLADLFEEKVSQQVSAGRQEARERSQAIHEFKRNERALDSCQWCFDSKAMLKHLVIAIGTKVYLSVPPYQSLTEGHCLIAPIHHVPCATQLDEDVWAEVQTFRRALTAMFLKMDQDVVYIETAMKLRHFPHMMLECIPMPTETGHMAPIYFKKAILECEMEWSNNRKLVDTMGRDVRRAIPKGLPYFSVDFGNEGGFAHVIEEEALFPKYFAQEIVGGMLDLDHNLWRKPKRENFDAQRKKVLQFAEWWKPFDFTNAQSGSGSDSSSD